MLGFETMINPDKWSFAGCLLNRSIVSPKSDEGREEAEEVWERFCCYTGKKDRYDGVF